MPLQREPSTARNQASVSPTKEEEHNPDVVDAFGSLAISPLGKAKFFGQTANSWLFLQNQTDEPEEYNHMAALQTILPPEILARSSAFPIAPSSTSQDIDAVRLQSLYWYLPAYEKAVALKTIYYTHAAWMYNPISSELFDSDILDQFYNPNAASPTEEPMLSHRLSLLFIVLAIGTLMDTAQQPPYNLEAEKYHQLARAALFQNSLFDEPTINAVQSLFLMTFYLFLADRHGTSSGARWGIMGIAVKMAQSIGLHRDSGRWGVDQIETQRRRELFWELYTYDSWQCLTFGRPPSFTLAHVDCKMPYPSDSPDEQSFHAWKHRFSSECMSTLHDQAFGAKNPTYATVLQLDRKMRAFPVPPVLQVAGFGSSEPRPGGFPDTVMLTLQRHIVLAIREMDLLYLHRSFFARAVSDHPKDPLGSPYGTSVIAAYRSAGSLVALMRNLHTQLKETSERIWFLWTHMFSCAIVLGSIVTRCPSMSLAPSALVQLDSACELFSKAAPGFRAGKVLEIMLRLQAKAHASLDDFRKGKSSPLGRHMTSEPPTPVDDEDELSTLGGKTRLVAKKEPQSPSPQILERSPVSQNPVVPLPLQLSTKSSVDPNVLRYLETFGPQHHQQQQQHQAQSQQHMVNAQASTSAAGASFPDMDVSMYGLSTLSGPYHQEPTSYQPQMMQTDPQQLSSPTLMHQQQPSQPQQAQQMTHALNGFPQYFPVYDYTTTGMGETGYSPVIETTTPAHVNGAGAGPGTRRGSGTPEANMHTTWNDFVAGLAMN
ncbi:hypothetical protein HGRIS_004688 [Hohenbuehelia grisea]|uniref:Xylanolytic transcriptional activator regulatory domain-containing protein n=1 Tax=Hohenbuehelia grisea TaxID=104357 RepID=A0ABR3JEB3_9AGAR